MCRSVALTLTQQGGVQQQRWSKVVSRDAIESTSAAAYSHHVLPDFSVSLLKRKDCYSPSKACLAATGVGACRVGDDRGVGDAATTDVGTWRFD